MSGAISVSHAIANTDIALRRQLPAIATIRMDQESFMRELLERDEVEIERVTPATLREIGQLSYVRTFDYFLTHRLFSETLMRTFNLSAFDVLSSAVAPNDSESLQGQGVDWLEWFQLKGVYEANVLDIEAGLIDLVVGRTFTQAEAESGAQVAIVSQSWLDENSLILGDTFTLQQRIHGIEQFLNTDHFTFTDYFSDENLLVSEDFDFEIIGVFDHEIRFRASLDSFDVENFAAIEEHMRILNQIYIPISFVESLINMSNEILGDDLLDDTVLADTEDNYFSYSAIFLLNDPLDLEAFKEAATPLLPDLMMIDIATHTYADFSTSMEMIRGIPTLITIGAIFATTIILCLIIFLFLYDRKYEIGLYLALGEEKIKIFFQFLLEIVIIVPIAVTIGLLIGNVISSNLSTNMIRQELISQSEQAHITTIWADSPANLGFRHDITPEEVLEFFDTSLDIYTVIFFYSSTLLLIVFSTALSTIYALKLSPKYILMKGTIG